ncbi:MAG: LPS-assembly protein LptD [Geobacter sp.]|nr:MAG: LPS-assembly protein LptD [Geobacter sp.]
MSIAVRKLCLVIAFLALHAIPAAAAEGVPKTDEVKIKADTMSYEKEKDLLQAEGNVEISWDQFLLLSDRAMVSQSENEAAAEGKVKLLKDGDILTSDRIRINYETQQGEAENGDLFIKQRNFRMHGTRFLKTGKEQYRLERGSFTTCDGDTPSWKFTASDLDVTIDAYAKGRNAVLYVKDIPVFYTPYILFPVKRERQSGFLFPRLGSSTKKGFYLDIPYYWAISPSQEVTFDIDGQTKRGAALGIDYLYLRPRGSHGELKSYLIYDTQQDRERGYVTLRGHEFLSPSLTLTSDINLTLDRDFFRDYGESSGDYNRQILDSTFFATKNRGENSLTAEVRFVQNLDLPSDRDTLQKLPVLSFTRVRSPIGRTPFYGGIESSFTDFYREDGIRGQRLDIHPTLSLYHAFPQGLDLSAWGGYRQRFYNAYGADAGRGYHGEGLFDAGATASSSLSRVFAIEKGMLQAVRHTLIPELGYSFVQEKDQERLPFFDWEDRNIGGSMATWALSNYVTAKYTDLSGSTATYRDILYLKLSQGYQLEGPQPQVHQQPRDRLTLIDEGRRFTDIRVEARYSPTESLSIATDSRYNPYKTRFSTATLGLDFNNGRGDIAGVSYRFARDQVEYLEGKVALALVKPFVFNYNCRYSFSNSRFLESVYTVEYRQQCWSVVFSYRDRPDDKGFVLAFTLSGIGAIGPKTF